MLLLRQAAIELDVRDLWIIDLGAVGVCYISLGGNTGALHKVALDKIASNCMEGHLRVGLHANTDADRVHALGIVPDSIAVRSTGAVNRLRGRCDGYGFKLGHIANQLSSFLTTPNATTFAALWDRVADIPANQGNAQPVADPDVVLLWDTKAQIEARS
ncbi:MAG: hypothetical protein ABL949_08060 [Fimbriimonadaceae bacterium]